MQSPHGEMGTKVKAEPKSLALKTWDTDSEPK